ncbi:YbjQ family protein [Nioella aestuarii]|uniref:YbjQ family protein n=1 Tax=Nioella aestuarii TaxID=1662864 RepID=UPI003D7F2E43
MGQINPESMRGLKPDVVLTSDSRDREVEAAAELRNQVRKVLVTTEMQPDINIQERITIITAECAYGMNLFKDMFASVRNIVGGRSEAVQKTMRDARETVLYELKKEAHRVGANAVVGVDLDYTQIGSGGNTMVMLVASGTAVVIGEGC